MMMNEDQNQTSGTYSNVNAAVGFLVAGGLTLHLFWVVNLFKAAYSGFSDVLNFYPPVGPLLGVYLICAVGFLILSAVFQKDSLIKDQARAYWFFVGSTLVFSLMVFPPIFEPIAHLLGG